MKIKDKTRLGSGHRPKALGPRCHVASWRPRGRRRRPLRSPCRCHLCFSFFRRCRHSICLQVTSRRSPFPSPLCNKPTWCSTSLFHMQNQRILIGVSILEINTQPLPTAGKCMLGGPCLGGGAAGASLSVSALSATACFPPDSPADSAAASLASRTSFLPETGRPRARRRSLTALAVTSFCGAACTGRSPVTTAHQDSCSEMDVPPFS